MKLLSDFDGVWTNPEAEARAQGAFIDRTLIEWNPEHGRPRIAAWIAQARSACAAEPTRYGWAPGGGRLSAFADEDPFAPHGAFLHFLGLEASTDEQARRLVALIREHGFPDLDAFGSHAHARGVEQVAETQGPGVLPAAAEAGRRLLDAGVEVLVVSNSSPAKLERWFGAAGVPHATHPQAAPGRLRLRGGARKFVLGDSGRRPLSLGALEVDVDRPHYEQILREERPQAVVGDVFSLDLALPLWLRRGEAGWRGTRLFWLLQPYTPSWLRAESRRPAPEIEEVEGGFPRVADALLGGSSVAAQPPRS